MLARVYTPKVSTLASLSFAKPWLDLRDVDLEDEEFQLDEAFLSANPKTH